MNYAMRKTKEAGISRYRCSATADTQSGGFPKGYGERKIRKTQEDSRNGLGGFEKGVRREAGEFQERVRSIQKWGRRIPEWLGEFQERVRSIQKWGRRIPGAVLFLLRG